VNTKYPEGFEQTHYDIQWISFVLQELPTVQGKGNFKAIPEMLRKAILFPEF
jgi:hypothetical protein